MADLRELDKTFSIHEQVCAERWTETINRIKRLESVLIGSAGAIILLLVGIVLKVH
jgi:predicted nucleic acid-binding Zn ribbon protein